MIIWPFCAFYITSILVLFNNTVCRYINLIMFQVNGAVKYILGGFLLQFISYLFIALVLTNHHFIQV